MHYMTINKTSLFAVFTGLTLLVLSFVLIMHSQPVLADARSDVCNGIGLTTGSSSNPGCAGSSNVDNIVATVVNILSVIVGVVAVIMIIVGGIKFVVSQGEANNVSSARNTILYAIVGLVIVFLAQIIVRFVLNRLQK